MLAAWLSSFVSKMSHFSFHLIVLSLPKRTFYIVSLICVALNFYRNKHHVCELEMGSKRKPVRLPFGVTWVRKNEKEFSVHFLVV